MSDVDGTLLVKDVSPDSGFVRQLVQPIHLLAWIALLSFASVFLFSPLPRLTSNSLRSEIDSTSLVNFYDSRSLPECLLVRSFTPVSFCSSDISVPFFRQWSTLTSITWNFDANVASPDAFAHLIFR